MHGKELQEMFKMWLGQVDEAPALSTVLEKGVISSSGGALSTVLEKEVISSSGV